MSLFEALMHFPRALQWNGGLDIKIVAGITFVNILKYIYIWTYMYMSTTKQYNLSHST